MKVRMTLDMPDEARRAIRAHSGEKGLATRKEVIGWVEMLIDATLPDLMNETEDENK